MSIVGDMAAEAARILREKTPQEIVNLFVKHGVQPQARTFITRDPNSNRPCGCCPIGVAVLDAALSQHGDELEGEMLGAASVAYLDNADIFDLELGFAGNLSGQVTNKAMFDKGKRVWDLATQTKEQA